jgi:hypothetical protein
MTTSEGPACTSKRLRPRLDNAGLTGSMMRMTDDRQDHFSLSHPGKARWRRAWCIRLKTPRWAAVWLWSACQERWPSSIKGQTPTLTQSQPRPYPRHHQNAEKRHPWLLLPHHGNVSSPNGVLHPRPSEIRFSPVKNQVGPWISENPVLTFPSVE